MVITIILVRELERMMQRAASMPLSNGMEMSSTAISGLTSRHIRTAAFPSKASLTKRNPFALRMLLTSARTVRSSSATTNFNSRRSVISKSPERGLRNRKQRAARNLLNCHWQRPGNWLRMLMTGGVATQLGGCCIRAVRSLKGRCKPPYPLKSAPFCIRNNLVLWRSDNTLPDRVANQAYNLMNIELLHDVHSVRFSGLGADSQDASNLLYIFPLYNQLQHLPFPNAQRIRRTLVLRQIFSGISPLCAPRQLPVSSSKRPYFLSRMLRCPRAVPTKKSVHIEIVAFTESRPVAFPSHVDSTLLSARLLPSPRRSASRDSCSPTSALGLAAFEPSSQAPPRLG